MADRFRVALSGDFRKADGSPTYPDFDLAPLGATPGVETVFLEPANPLLAAQLEDFDALILLGSRFAAGRVPRGVVNREVLETAAWQDRLDRYQKRFGN